MKQIHDRRALGAKRAQRGGELRSRHKVAKKLAVGGGNLRHSRKSPVEDYDRGVQVAKKELADGTINKSGRSGIAIRQVLRQGSEVQGSNLSYGLHLRSFSSPVA